MTQTAPFILSMILVGSNAAAYDYPRIFSIGFYVTSEDELNADTTDEVYFTGTDPQTGDEVYVSTAAFQAGKP